MKLKGIILTALIVTSIFGTIASAAAYEEVMKENIEKMYQVKSASELTSISATFYRVAQKEQDKWLPLYYASYSLVRIAFFIKDAGEIDKHLDVAQGYLDKLKEKKPKESEVHVLQALLYSMRITSPTRGMKYSMLSNGALDDAAELDLQNPRLYYCRGNNVFHTPSMFGGGKSKAKPLFEKASELFETESSGGTLMPNWGKWHNNQMLEKCKEE